MTISNKNKFLTFGIQTYAISCLIMILLSGTIVYAGSTTSLTISQDEAYAADASYAEIKTFVTDALKNSGLDAKVVALPLERANISSSKGEIDGQLARVPAILKQYPRLRGTSFPIIHINVRFIYLKSKKNFDEKNLRKYFGAGPLNNHGIVTKELHYTQVFSPEQAISMLESGRVDYVLLPEPIIFDRLKQNPKLEKKCIVSKRVFTTFPLYFILNEKKSYLLPQIENSLREALKKNRSKYPLIMDSLNSNL